MPHDAPATTVAGRLRQHARGSFHSVKHHVAAALVQIGLADHKANAWAYGLEGVAIANKHRGAWSKLWSLESSMVCGGPLSSGMVGAEHHPILTLRALSKIDNRAERAALLSDIEMDHSLQPVTRTCRLWVEAVGSNAQWFQGVSVELLLHCIYGVEANTINGKSWPTAVVPRCKR